jgi:hypothetical protein
MVGKLDWSLLVEFALSADHKPKRS